MIAAARRSRAASSPSPGSTASANRLSRARKTWIAGQLEAGGHRFTVDNGAEGALRIRQKPVAGRRHARFPVTFHRGDTVSIRHDRGARDCPWPGGLRRRRSASGSAGLQIHRNRERSSAIPERAGHDPSRRPRDDRTRTAGCRSRRPEGCSPCLIPCRTRIPVRHLALMAGYRSTRPRGCTPAGDRLDRSQEQGAPVPWRMRLYPQKQTSLPPMRST